MKHHYQMRLFTCLGNASTPDRETIDLRISLLDHLAIQWYGEMQRIDDAQCDGCGGQLYFHYNYLDPKGKAIAYCRVCGWFAEVEMSEGE